MQGILGATDRTNIIQCTDIETSSKNLESVITEAMNIVEPIETKELGKRPINQWLMPGILISIKHSNKLFKQWKRNKTNTDKQFYRKYKNILELSIPKILKKNDYHETSIKWAGPGTRKLWSIINKIIDRNQCKHKLRKRFIINDKE